MELDEETDALARLHLMQALREDKRMDSAPQQAFAAGFDVTKQELARKDMQLGPDAGFGRMSAQQPFGATCRIEFGSAPVGREVFRPIC
ncbi:MAG TPA: hypothetical protein VNS02_00165 [Rhizobiaceae bacterium]|nr:hypothetical protein [Rhizobiaceae bacterium]